MLAASNNHAAIVELLLLNGAEINHKEKTQGWSALIWSAKRGHLDTVKLLLTYKADKAIRDYKGMSALDWAVKSKHEEVVSLLQTQTK
jgi:ankyrin repeat protein